MTENNQTEAPKKKLSLQELMKQQLENKKNQAAAGKGKANQQTKKPINTRRNMCV